MTFRWSSESIVAEYKELQANTMAIDVNGQYALLAGRRNIAIIDLEKPTEIVKRMARTQQKYNVTVAEWNPNSPMKNTFVLAAGDKAEMFSWNEGNLLSESTLKAHTRTITDLNWHRSEPMLLATSSIDTFIHIWDARETRKPSISLSAVAGASQVKWNKLNGDYLASGHDCDIRIWDRRKANQPVCYINAHLSKIHGLDWSPNHDTQIVSSSNDSTVKFFDITNPRKSEIYINTQNPVWRARYTPFGEGLVTVVVPPLRRSENSLLLWSMMDTSNPVHTFVGHCDIVLEFDWLYKPNSDMHSADYQLITWAKDNSLRIWKIDPQLLKLCGHSFDEEVTGTDEANTESSDAETLLGYENGEGNIMATKVIEEYNSVTNKEGTGILSQRNNSFDALNINGLPQFDTERKTIPRNLSFCESPKEFISQSPDTPSQRSLSQTPCALESLILGGSQTNMYTCNLQQEFVTLNSSFGKNVEIVSDAEKRICQVTVKHLIYVAVLSITFPPKYPNGSCPSFRFSAGTNLDPATKAELLRVLKSTALQYTSIKKKKGCLEPCLKILISQLKALLTEERTSVLDMPQLHLNNSFFLQMYGSQQDYTIPFPRTSGARFCSSGYLVCFTRPSVWKHSTSRERTLTPRSLSALGAHINSLYPQLTSGSATSPKYNYLYPVTGQSPSAEHNISIAMYYYQDRKMKSKRMREEESGRHHRNHGVITIYDVSKLIPVSKELASSYVIDEDTVTSCNLNKEAAASLGRKDISQVWAISSTLLSMNSLHSKDDDYPFIHHPFGRKLTLLLINHYHSRFDIQTAALLSCVFGENLAKANKNKNFDPWRNKSDSSSSSTGSSPYNTIHGVNTEGWEMSTFIRHNRSNSEGSLTEASRPPTDSSQVIGENADAKKACVPSLLEPSKSEEYNEIRAAYADVLCRWELLEQRAMIKKFTREYSANKDKEFHVEYSNCGRPSCKNTQCHYCKKVPYVCSICRLPVRGSSNFCLVCGHGGHTSHYRDWFEEFDECPTGCGCKCLTTMEELFG